MQKKARRLPPVHPGEVLREELLLPLAISINRLGRDLRVPVTRMSEIVNGRRGITADTALRLARYFGTTAEFWMNSPISMPASKPAATRSIRLLSVVTSRMTSG